jgi:hypothetical protein
MSLESALVTRSRQEFDHAGCPEETRAMSCVLIARWHWTHSDSNLAAVHCLLEDTQTSRPCSRTTEPAAFLDNFEIPRRQGTRATEENDIFWNPSSQYGNLGEVAAELLPILIGRLFPTRRNDAGCTDGSRRSPRLRYTRRLEVRLASNHRHCG